MTTFDSQNQDGAQYDAAPSQQQATQDGSSLLAILDEIREVVVNARPVPMSATVRVNRAELMELVEAAVGVVPPSISTAEHIVAESRDTIERAQAEAQRILTETAQKREEILADAEAEAERIVATARAQGEELIADERVVHLAEHRSRELVAEARAEASRLADNANVYADERLAEFEEELEKLRQQVAAGREAITQRRADVAEDLENAYNAAEEARREQATDTADRPAAKRGETAADAATAPENEDDDTTAEDAETAQEENQ